MARTVAALYVDILHGAYVGMPGVEMWGFAHKADGTKDPRSRDARKYPGPYPVVAHPPCGPWGRFWWRYKGGEGDADCGIEAVEAVRKWGGVLEHPHHSGLWAAAELPKPGDVDSYGGFTVAVNQVNYGHPTIKPTWVYCCGVEWWDAGIPAEPTYTIVRRRDNPNDLPELPKKLRHLTPPRFGEHLVAVARTAYDLRK